MTNLERQILLHIYTASEMGHQYPTKQDLKRKTGRDDIEHPTNSLHLAGLIAKVTVRKPHSDYRYQITDAGKALVKGATA